MDRLWFAYYTSAFLGVAGLTAAFSIGIFEGTLLVLSTFVYTQVVFVCVHVSFHVLFAKYGSEASVRTHGVGGLLAHIHHYDDPQLFPKHWLLYRTAAVLTSQTFFRYPAAEYHTLYFTLGQGIVAALFF
eukprot:SAG31_NODE_23633_length_500_cov_0.643392_1_plen_129_part_10